MGYGCRKHKVDIHYFDCIDTESKAYWLGFLAADGSVLKAARPHSLRLDLQPGDIDHLGRFLKALSGEAYPIRMNRGYPYVCITSVVMMDALARWGIIPNKGKTLTFPALHAALLPHYIRGYYDGDGCFTVGKNKQARITFCGNLAFIQSLGTNINQEAALRPTRLDRAYKNVVKFCCSGNPKSSRLLSYLYKDATIWLPRKREKAEAHFLLLGQTRKRLRKLDIFGDLFH